MNLATQNDYHYVEQIVAKSKSSFTLGMKALPKNRRGFLYAIYAYCRVLDDIADEAGAQDVKLRMLDDWRGKIDDLLNGSPQCEITRILHDAIHQFTIPTEELYLLIEGMKVDVLGPVQAPSWDELDTYCRQVAVSVGLLSLPIFGRSDEIAKEFGIELGHALQLTNILRDVVEDSTEERLYLPSESLDRQGLSHDPKIAVTQDLSKVMAEVAQKAQLHYENADRLLSQAGSKNLQPALMMMAVYRKLFEKLQRRGWTVISPRMRLSTPEKALIIMKYLALG